MKRQQGFTLVELIVVIAIIAILAAVTVPAFTGYINNARLSNDNQAASQMTRIIDAYLTENPGEELDAYDVKLLIDEANDGEFDYTPTSRSTGFFFIESTNEVIVATYEEAQDVIQQLTLNRANLLVDKDLALDENNLRPTELFGAGSHLLTTEGSPIAVMVDFVNNMADSGSRIVTEYQEAIDALNDSQGRLFARLFGGTLSDELLDKAESFLEDFNPSTTLYVNSTSWTTTATDASAIRRIVFRPGISTVPTFDLSISGQITGVITLPSTVKMAEYGAIPSSSFDIELEYRSDQQIKIASGIVVSDVFGGVSNFSSNRVSSERITLKVYQGMIEVIGGTNIDLAMLREALAEDNIKVTGYKLDINLNYPSLSRVYIYTKDGLVGYATPQPVHRYLS